MNPILRFLLLAFAWFCFALGIVGVFVPVLPTTPLILLATFICARYSPRCHRIITNSKVYRSYVLPFKEAGGMTGKAKARMLAISYTVLFISAVLVQRPMVWIILTCVAIFLLYLVCIRIPTVGTLEVAAHKETEEIS